MSNEDLRRHYDRHALRTCTHACVPNHAENCPRCFGWGFDRTVDGRLDLVAARDLDDTPAHGSVACEYCYGSRQGLPSTFRFTPRG